MASRVVDVNYGGSTGYGRAYRERLYGSWGVVDTADCINAARYLVDQGEVDGDRLLIAGGSAGGYTTLCALTFHDDFAAGASYYGISDLEPFAKPGGTHKFESQIRAHARSARTRKRRISTGLGRRSTSWT